MMRRRISSALTVALAGACSLGASCKKKDDLRPVTFDEDAVSLAADPEATLAPAWGAPGRAVLDNDLQLFWLVEEDSPQLHVRLLLSTTNRADEVGAAATLVVLVALQDELRRRIKRAAGDDDDFTDASVQVSLAPGRAELSVHADAVEAERVLDTLATLLSDRKPERFLARAHGLAVANTADLDHAGSITALMTARLLGLPPGQERVNKQQMAAMSRNQLERAWTALLDPRACVLLVHAPELPERLAGPLARLGTEWKAPGGLFGGRKTGLGAVERFRSPDAPQTPEGAGFLLGDPSATLFLTGPHTREQAVAMLGRVIPTPDPTSRARARLAQRILQQSTDARLVVGGEVSLLLIRVPLKRKDPRSSLSSFVESLEEFHDEPLPRERLEAATRLWLGARVVQASFDGEDWTQLFSESLDLADGEDDIPIALARDAKLMLETTPEQLHEFMLQWTHPRKGEPGWTWAVIGVDDERAAQLGELTVTKRLGH